MKTPQLDLQDSLKYLLVHTIIVTFGRLPLCVLHRIGAAIGNLAWVMRVRKCNVIEHNLSLVRPELNPHTRKLLARRVLAEIFKSLVEVFGVWANPRRTLKQVVEVRGLDILDSALASKSGLILCNPHLGSLEVLSLWLSTRVLPKNYAFLYRRSGSKSLDALLNKFRAGPQTKQVAISDTGIRVISQYLKYGGMVAISPDHVPGRNRGAVRAPFFGVAVATGTLVPRLAHRFNANVLSVFAERLSDGKGYRIHINSVPREIAEKDPLVACSALNASVEACISQAFNQYQWSYERFR